ncbi:MAG: methylmalonyl-CoA epimerase [Calditrichaceae bacterium]|nr:methylmalonyl-CoA epimerase [Calditrichaceae bacterium]
MITKINHIGIAVNSLDEQIGFYRDVLNLDFEGIEAVHDQMVRAALFKVGEVRIELLEPTSPESPIAKFIEKKGEGMHHIAYETDQIDNEISGLKKAGIQMIDENPKPGAQHTTIAFIHPKSSGKVLTEICQHTKLY